MVKKVKLKNLNGDFLHPYTDNVPTDSIPTNNSTNLITSGAVYTALSNKSDVDGTVAKAIADKNGNDISLTYLQKNIPVITLASSGTIALSDNSINRITPTGNVIFSLPTISDNNIFHQILVQVYLSTALTIELGTNCFFNTEVPDLSKSGIYNIIYEHNGTNWVSGILFTEVSEASYTQNLYAWLVSERGLSEIIYTKTSTISSDTELYNADNSPYTGSEWSISGTDLIYQDSEGKYDVTYANRYEEGDILFESTNELITSGDTTS